LNFFLPTNNKQSKLVEQNIKIKDVFKAIIIYREQYLFGKIPQEYQNEISK
jgi:hypothetical protein